MSAMTDASVVARLVDAVWSACGPLREAVGGPRYRGYALATLVLKCVSDMQKDLHRQPLRRSDGIAEPEPTAPPGSPTMTAVFDFLYAHREDDDIGALINAALREIEWANRSELDGVFDGIDFESDVDLGRAQERNRRLKRLLENFYGAELDLRPSSVGSGAHGEVARSLVARFAAESGHDSDRLHTPRYVAALMARLVAPEDGDRIFDPACGSGTLLIEAARTMSPRHCELYGQESDGATWALARMNMFLQGEKASRIAPGNALTDPAMLTNDGQLQQFDIVLTNPPFSTGWNAEAAINDPHQRFWRGAPPKGRADYAFILHSIESAHRRNGRVAVVVPHGVLFRGGSEGRIRRALIDENLLDTVIALPSKLFRSTGIPVAILIFDRSREAGGANSWRDDVVFIDASHGFVAAKHQNLLDERQIDRIAESYLDRGETDRFAHSASRSEIAANGYNLSVSRYVDISEPTVAISAALLRSEIDEIDAELALTRASLTERMKELGIDV